MISEIENLANSHKSKGFDGLDELKDLRFECQRLGVEIIITGERPSLEQIKLASSGELDAKIRDVAKEQDAILYTSDRILVSMCEIEGIEVEYLKHPPRKKPLKRIFDYFDKNTMSVHLRENVIPVAKKGKPGNWELIKLKEDPLTSGELDDIISDILTIARSTPDCFIEMDEPGAKVIQLEAMRIVVAQPPFSDALEVTAVNPITKLSLSDYNLSKNLLERLRERAEGILIAGSPGAGKSTFAQAVANFYASLNKTVKTVERPRDLEVGPEVSQYTALAGDFRKTADVMLLIRPDFVIFDELRKTDDFLAFSDMRLAGIGLVGVIHSTTSIEAIQRFIGRIDLGMIPSILDTVIFIKAGRIADVLELRMTVKVPTGMKERDLARPVIEVRDFETRKLLYDIFVFGEQVSVIPVDEAVRKVPPLSPNQRKVIKQLVQQYIKGNEIKIERTGQRSVRIEVPEDEIPKIIGYKGKTVSELEDKLGMKIDVEALSQFDWGESNEILEESSQPMGYGIPIDIRLTRNRVILSMPEFARGTNIEIIADNQSIFSGAVGKRGEIKIDRNSAIAKKIIQLMNKGETIYAHVK